MTVTFTELGISNDIVKAMTDMGWTEPTPVQIEAVPIGLSGCDMFAQAQTGTGKTGTYGSIVLSLTKSGATYPTVLTLVPTRELATQVSDEIGRLSAYTGHKCIPIYGGVSIDTQIRKLKKGVDMVIGTPGRVKDLINRHELDLFKVSIVVLDEADRMLDMGFSKDLEFILSKVSKKRQTLLFSATMTPDIKRLAVKHMKDYKEALVSKDEPTLDLTKQYYLMTDKDSKRDELCRILDRNNPKTIVFCHTKRRVSQLSKKLTGAGYAVDAIHGDVSQNRRERAIQRFKDDTIDALIATDVAARGLDIEDIDCVVNLDMPVDPETYVHRIGRTGRAGKEGIAVTFVLSDEVRDLRDIERQIGKKIDPFDIAIFDEMDHPVREKAPPLEKDPAQGKPAKKVKASESETPKKRSRSSDDAAPKKKPRSESVSESPKKRPKVESETPKKVKASEKQDPVPKKESKPVSETPKKSEGSKKKPKKIDNKVSVEVGLGMMDGMDKASVCEFVKKKGSLQPKDVGRISIFEKKSFVEIDKEKVDLAVTYLSKCKYEGRLIKVRVIPEKKD